MAVVRKAYHQLTREFRTRHPFAHLSLRRAGRQILVKVSEVIAENTLTDAITRQNVFENVIAPHLECIDYSDATGFAERWHIAEGVVIDPEIAFGRATVAQTRVPTAVIAAAFRANDADEDVVADLYELSLDQVRLALHFEDGLGRAA